MTVHRLSDAAHLLGVSDDTLRRWVDAGRVPADRTTDGRAGIPGTALAALARELADIPTDGSAASSQRVSARNQLRGIVTDVKRDAVMAQVELC
ncbi:MAG: helix-turn-helix domain-containing protein, partial [Propionibacteriales bacterium]|nr:helix-turn-helix domain-containing protein [Propionibacteriales bacterium]